jgi:hypothetical protein
VSAATTRRFAAVFADLNRNPVVQAGDMLEVIIRSNAGSIVAGPIVRQIGMADIRKAYTDIIMRFGELRPKKSALAQNYPNPFNPDTWIPYQLAEDADVTIRIYSASGRLVRVLDLHHKSAGTYLSKHRAAHWDGKNDNGEPVSSGIYAYSIQAGDFTGVRKMVILK